jgi:predicted RNase H-like HicB family nuclease
LARDIVFPRTERSSEGARIGFQERFFMTWPRFWSALRQRKAKTGPPSGSILTAVFRRGEDGFIVAECPELPGCMSQGKTKEEALRNIQDAITSVLIVRMHSQLKSDFNRSEQCRDEMLDCETFRVKDPELTSV